MASSPINLLDPGLGIQNIMDPGTAGRPDGPQGQRQARRTGFRA